MYIIHIYIQTILYIYEIILNLNLNNVIIIML